MTSNIVPLIDCSTINGNFDEISAIDLNAVANEIGAAMTGIGMCNLINHGVDMKKIETIYKVSDKFFNLPEEKKLKYRCDVQTKSIHGYGCAGDQKFTEATELKEWWYVAGLDADHECKYPNEEIPEFKLAFDDIRSDLKNLTKIFLRCVEIYLKLEEEFLISKHQNLGLKKHIEMRSLYYYTIKPEDKIPENSIRLGEHQDFGTVTFVMQDLVGGLEVKTSDNKWIEAVPVKDAILVNSGLLLEYWTGGLFHAAPHRVKKLPDMRMNARPRQSFVYFADPDEGTHVYPTLPVLPQKKMEFERFGNRVIESTSFIQGLIDASTIRRY
ncbi:putative iron/ascorbate oxidoreductase [Pseudolycoriella hygida]|uniref:Iron/ascorbate oxidoreductase n=1 Tax=Pseudolycoriella hygida TaxID=35572 RepID=A0A9Q0RVE4_9DIPT|nr:putative iron/ascorbate oxidoreductase [Pseudolycoriella hygida]